jgi:hypothetical protein
MLDVATISPPADAFREEVERLRASGVLGRSDRLLRLFDFLVRCREQGRVPKEVEVAIGAFGRSPGFDSGQDALVRVHAHKLRRRLEDHYRLEAPEHPWRLVVPRGEYRLSLEEREAAVVDAAAPLEATVPVAPQGAGRRERWAWRLCGLLAAACLALLLHGRLDERSDGRSLAVRDSVLWAPLMADDLPIQVVLGDYYIYGEREPGGEIQRLVRDFDVNSRADLEQRFIADPALTARYADLDLGYLPTSSAQALRQILPVVIATGKPVSLTLASELDPASLKSTHVVYVGLLSALGMMQDMAFSGSRYAFGGSFDELLDHDTGEAWVSEAGEPHSDAERYRDYAYLSTFTGPVGNAHIVIAGTRDTGLMQSAEIAADPRQLVQLGAQAPAPKGWEALFEVQGINGMNMESRLVHAGALEATKLSSE